MASSNHPLTKWPDHSTRAVTRWRAQQSIHILKSKMPRRTTIIWMRKMLKNLMVQGMYWCMDLILDQHCLSTHTPKNKLTSRPSIINHISKTNPNSPAPKPNQISTELGTQLVTTTKSQKKPSRTSPHWWAKTKKNKEMRRKRQAFREVGCPPKTKD